MYTVYLPSLFKSGLVSQRLSQSHVEIQIGLGFESLRSRHVDVVMVECSNHIGTWSAGANIVTHGGKMGIWHMITK